MSRVLPIPPVLPSLDVLAATLKRYACELPAEELPTLVGELEAAKARAWTRLLAAERASAPQRASDTHKLLDAKAMAERLQVPESWLREHARRGRIPCVYVGRYMRFDPDAMLRAVSTPHPA